MRYVAPTREMVDPAVFDRLPLAAWSDFAALLKGPTWPLMNALNQYWPAGSSQCFVAQTPVLLADGLHYEQRIAERGQIATREGNWHDLLNALVWLRYADLKQALNQRQMGEIARIGTKQRSRAQYAMTHFDEGGAVVVLSDLSLLALWDAHDWHALFWRRRQAWLDGTIRLELFGHALLELALCPAKLLVTKALVFHADAAVVPTARCATAIRAGQLLQDPLELRPLPLSGLPGWRADNAEEAFHLSTPCYQPRRAGRVYPAALGWR